MTKEQFENLKIGDIVRGEAGFLDVVLGIVVGYWEDRNGIQQPNVRWLEGFYEGETFAALSGELEVLA
jgi:hypothetical protein